MRKFRLKEPTAFLTTLLACAAFLVGAVKIWGVDADKLFSGLAMVLLMLGGLILLALVVVFVVKVISGRKGE